VACDPVLALAELPSAIKSRACSLVSQWVVETRLAVPTGQLFSMSKPATPVTDSDLLQSGYRYGLSLSASRQEAGDLVHDAWLRLVKRYMKTPEKPLLFKTIRNLYIDQLRRQQRVWQHQQDEYFEYSSVESELERDIITADEMQYHLARLGDVEREALYLSAVEGYTADEIAAMTESTRGTVLSRLHRCKRKLRNWLVDEAPVAENVVNLAIRKTKS